MEQFYPESIIGGILKPPKSILVYILKFFGETFLLPCFIQDPPKPSKKTEGLEQLVVQFEDCIRTGRITKIGEGDVPVRK